MDWNGGLDWWTGVLDWSTGVEYWSTGILECYTLLCVAFFAALLDKFRTSAS